MMKSKKYLSPIILMLTLITGMCCVVNVNAQITSGVYISDVDNLRHELKITENYFIHSVYTESPAKFIKTEGGFYTTEGNNIHVKLEFNSNFEKDGIKEMNIPYSYENGDLILSLEGKVNFGIAIPSFVQDLDGVWLFATRGPDEGQDRRGDENPRKTMKFLMDGRFQWIAYHTETFKFSGTGGGSYTAMDGVYTENIDYFSRDDSRVGATLKFDYALKDGDWHHTGKTSKGEPMYEIWARR